MGLANAIATARRALAGPTRRAKRVGRNAPCPCGSGRKYKKCCLRKDRGRRSRTRRAGAPGVSGGDLPPHLAQALEPATDSDAALAGAVRQLGLLLLTDPQLADALRFDDDALAAHLEAHDLTGRWLDAQQELTLEARDAIIAPFADGRVTAEEIGRFDAAIVAAIPRHARDPHAVRALVTAAWLCDAWTQQDAELTAENLNPLAAVVFHNTAAALDDRDVSEALGALNERMRAAGLAADGEATWLRDNADGIATKIQEVGADHPALGGLGQPGLGLNLTSTMREGRVPVGPPLASVLPYVQALLLGSEEARRDPATYAAEVLGEEDAQLYLHFLDAWSADQEQTAPIDPASAGVEAMVVMMARGMVTTGGYADLFPALLEHVVERDGALSYLPGEGDVPPDHDAVKDPSTLQRLADIHEEQGYPGIAERTRQLATRAAALEPTASADDD